MKKFKLSYYTIFADTPDSSDKTIIYSSRTGRGKVISNLCYKYLLEERFDELPQEIRDELINSKIIVEASEDELNTIVEENEASSLNNQNTLYEVIQPSAMCQLGCYYCGQDHVKHNMDNSIFEAMLKRIEGKIKSGTYNSLYIGWFGAEPLLALKQMKAITKGLVELTSAYKMNYSAKIVTNGVGLKANIYKLLVEKLHINKIEITLDGLAEYHDGHRYTKDGKGSFDIIYKNLKDSLGTGLRERCPISIRCNVDINNEKGVSGLIKKLAEDELHNKIAYFYPIGIYSWGGNDAQNESLKKTDFAKKEISWFNEKYNLGYPKGSILPKRKKTVCMAVTKSADMYDAYGNIFNCTEVSYSPVYKDEYYFNGNLKRSETLSVERPLVKWNRDVQNGEVQCEKCKIFPVCGGACPKSWKEGIGACPSVKFNLKQRMQLSYLYNKADISNVSVEATAFIESIKKEELFPV